MELEATKGDLQRAYQEIEMKDKSLSKLSE